MHQLQRDCWVVMVGLRYQEQGRDPSLDMAEKLMALKQGKKAKFHADRAIRWQVRLELLSEHDGQAEPGEAPGW